MVLGAAFDHGLRKNKQQFYIWISQQGAVNSGGGREPREASDAVAPEGPASHAALPRSQTSAQLYCSYVGSKGELSLSKHPAAL